MIICPEQFTIDSIEDLENFFHQYIRPNLPDPKKVAQFHTNLREYIMAEDSVVYIVRGNSQNKGLKLLSSDQRVFYINSDNEAAVWFWASCRPDSDRSIFHISQLIKDQIFPIGDSRSRNTQIKRGATWKNWGAGDQSWPIRQKGFWKHCHILDAKAKHLDRSERSIKTMMLRLLNPLNHFLFPTPRREFNDKIRGYNFNLRGLSKSDPGEDPFVKSSMQRLLGEYYGKELMADFMRLSNPAQDELSLRQPLGFSICGSRKLPEDGLKGQELFGEEFVVSSSPKIECVSQQGCPGEMNIQSGELHIYEAQLNRVLADYKNWSLKFKKPRARLITNDNRWVIEIEALVTLAEAQRKSCDLKRVARIDNGKLVFRIGENTNRADGKQFKIEGIDNGSYFVCVAVRDLHEKNILPFAA